jgi:hypothetical protein
MKSSDSTDASLAYQDAEFLGSDDARPVRIVAEYLEPLRRLRRQRVHDTVVFFGSARLTADGALGRFYTDARELARLIAIWSSGLPRKYDALSYARAAAAGIMEAANRGAHDAGARTIGLNISLPHEQRPNAYVTRELLFKFRYFFMRKLWFAHLARAIVVFPGGFGTLDELMEILTLAQTRKLERKIPIILYGPAYWNEIINFEALARHGVVSREDLKLFEFADDPQIALKLLQAELDMSEEEPTPAIAQSRCAT